jgi:hypothetical protein
MQNYFENWNRIFSFKSLAEYVYLALIICQSILYVVSCANLQYFIQYCPYNAVLNLIFSNRPTYKY